MSTYRSPWPVPGVIWASLPLPALLVGPDGMIREANPAAESFLNASAKSLFGQPVLDRIMIDAPMTTERRRPSQRSARTPPKMGVR